jgi:hypothetical protein
MIPAQLQPNIIYAINCLIGKRCDSQPVLLMYILTCYESLHFALCSQKGLELGLKVF